MSKRNLKKLVVPSIYVLAIFVFTFSMYLVQRVFNNEDFVNGEMQYVDKEIVNDNVYIPVVNDVATIIKPYLSDSVSVNKSFYNYKADSKEQENAIIYYEGIYMQNTGVDYISDESFDVLAIMDGTVIEVSDNEILGKTVKIQHENNIISVYQCLSDVKIKEKDMILSGQVIAKSGTSKVFSEKNNLHFEFFLQGKSVNPIDYYGKTVDEL